MAIKKRGVFAVPGKYKYGDIIEEKTPEELQAAAIRQPIVMLTKKHRPGGLPFTSDFLGTMSQKWNEEKQKVEADYWFYDEFLSPKLRAKLENNEPIPISAGFTLEDVVDGVQKGIYYTHVAVLEDEDPICPLNECGVNVRMESNSGQLRLEQSTEINKDEKPESVQKESEPVKVEEKYATVEDLSALKTEILDAISGLKQPEPEPEEPKPATPPPAQVEAETPIPADTGEPSKYGTGVTELDDGWLKIVPPKRNKESE